jgi:hypothetical protein
MCIICTLIEKEKLTAKEAVHAFWEAEVPEEHYDAVMEKILTIPPKKGEILDEDDDEEGPQ